MKRNPANPIPENTNPVFASQKHGRFPCLSLHFWGLVLAIMLPTHLAGGQDFATNTYTVSTEDFANPERGFYLHPKDYGQPEEKGVGWAQRPELMQRQKAEREKRQQQKNNER